MTNNNKNVLAEANAKTFVAQESAAPATEAKTQKPKKQKHNFYRNIPLLNMGENKVAVETQTAAVSTQSLKKPFNAKQAEALELASKAVVSNSDLGAYKPNKQNKNLKVIFLGGIGEISKNMTALEYGDDIIVIDAGSCFPSEDMPGIDLVVPDLTYLKQNKDRVKALILTHGHEDHIGSIPYFLQDLDVPVYGTRLTLALVENKISEFPNINLKGISVKPGQVFKVGAFNIEFIHINHSIAGSVALAINSPAGLVVHTGDFKIDYTPVITKDNGNRIADLNRFAELGKRGVTLMLSESTNICRAGFTMSETRVGEELDKIFSDHKQNRIFVAAFATNTYRLQQIISIAEKYGRKVAFSGRSMIRVCETCIKLGEIQVNQENIIDIKKVDKYDDKELCILTTGSQGEPMSALSRLAGDTFNGIKIGGNDCIILSSSPIPGNEKMVNRVINALYKKGATVINDELNLVHVSGHACVEEHKIIHSLVKPKYFIPVHGEYKHMFVHKQLAVKMGMNPRDVIIPDLGQVIEVNANTFKQVGFVPSGSLLIDGLGIGETDSVVLRDRKQLAEDGICVVVVGIDSLSGEITSGPELITRGLIYSQEIPDIVAEAKSVVSATVKGIDVKATDASEIRNLIRRSLQGYFSKKTKRRPIVLTIIIQD